MKCFAFFSFLSTWNIFLFNHTIFWFRCHLYCFFVSWSLKCLIFSKHYFIDPPNKLSTAFVVQAEEQLRIVEEQRKIHEERMKLEQERQRQQKEEQKMILGKGKSRPKLSFSLKASEWWKQCAFSRLSPDTQGFVLRTFLFVGLTWCVSNSKNNRNNRFVVCPSVSFPFYLSGFCYWLSTNLPIVHQSLRVHCTIGENKDRPDLLSCPNVR